MTFRRGISFAFGTASLLGVSVHAAAQTVQTSADVTVGGSYESNPFLLPDEDVDAGSIFIKIDPRIEFRDETTTVSLISSFELAYFTNGFDLDERASTELSVETQVNERLRFGSSASFQTSRSTAQDILSGSPSVLGVDGQLPDLPRIDATVAGLRIRNSSADGAINAEYQLTPVSLISGTISGRYSFFSGGLTDDFFETGAGLQYSRQLSEKISIASELDINVVDFNDRAAGDATIFTPTVGGAWRPNATATVELQLGISYADFDLGFGQANSQILVAGDISYCDRIDGGSFCLSARRRSQPTGSAGVSASTSGSFAYSRQLSEQDFWSISLLYQRNAQTQTNGFLEEVETSEYAGITTTFSRAIDSRLRASITPSFSRVDRELTGNLSNFSFLAGLTLTFGNER